MHSLKRLLHENRQNLFNTFNKESRDYILQLISRKEASRINKGEVAVDLKEREGDKKDRKI